MNKRLLAIGLCCVVGQAAIGALISDGDFGDHWDHEATGSWNRAFLTVENQSTGGTPDASRYTSQHASSQNITLKDIRVLHFYELVTHDPAASGPLGTVEISFDALAERIDASNEAVTFGPAVRQGDQPFHFDSGLLGQTTTGELGVWKHFRFSGLTEADFVPSRRFPSGTPLPQLDFSASGSPISFGYYAYVYKSHPNLFIAEAETRVDNWSANLGIVPEPAASAWWGAVWLGIVLRRSARDGQDADPRGGLSRQRWIGYRRGDLFPQR